MKHSHKILICLLCVILAAALMFSLFGCEAPLGQRTSHDLKIYQRIAGEHALLPSMDELPTADEGQPYDVDAVFTYYHMDYIIFQSDAYTLIVHYDPERYDYDAERKRVEEKYVFRTTAVYYGVGPHTLDPAFELDGFSFHLLDEEYYTHDSNPMLLPEIRMEVPKYMYFVGFNDEEKKIAYIYFEDFDLDVIDSFEEFLPEYCGWRSQK